MSYRDTVRFQQLTGRIAREREASRVQAPETARTGDRVRLLSTSDPYTKLQPGDEGTVTLVDSMGTVHCKWDSGSGLGLIPGEDQFVVLPGWLYNQADT
jgi:uncharacterized protein YodC (DUF2158 family)